jgi:hypothetical protein
MNFMKPPLPDIAAILSILESSMGGTTQPAEASVQSLAAVLRASYTDSAEYDELSSEYLESTDDANDLQQDTVLALSCLPCGAADSLVPELIAYFDSDDEFYELAHAIVSLAFPLSSSQSERLVLVRMQRDVLGAILRNDGVLENDLTFADHLIARGIPTDRVAIAQLAATDGNAG